MLFLNFICCTLNCSLVTECMLKSPRLSNKCNKEIQIYDRKIVITKYYYYDYYCSLDIAWSLLYWPHSGIIIFKNTASFVL